MLAAALNAPPAGPTVVIPPPASLREIGRVRSPVCPGIVAHANTAVVAIIEGRPARAREAAADFVEGLPKIAVAEGHAADQSVGAVNGCQ
jgi:hypothetical protein